MAPAEMPRSTALAACAAASAKELRALADDLNLFQRRARRVHSDWGWWHRRLTAHPDRAGGDGEPIESRRERLWGYAMAWSLDDAADSACVEQTTDAVAPVAERGAGTTATRRRFGWSVLVHFIEDEDDKTRREDREDREDRENRACLGAASSEDARRLKDRVRRGKSVWVPLLCDEMLGTVESATDDAHALTLRNARGAEIAVRRYQRVEVLCWWDLTRGVMGRRFQWCSPRITEFMGLDTGHEPATVRCVS